VTFREQSKIYNLHSTWLRFPSTVTGKFKFVDVHCRRSPDSSSLLYLVYRELNGSVLFLSPLPSANMHRCLQIPELLYNILENFSVPPPFEYWHYPRFRDLSRDLLAIALVSKTFCEPALDVLWSHQDSLPLLIKTFPRDLWTENGDPKKLVSFVFYQQHISYLHSIQTRLFDDFSPNRILTGICSMARR
jgi:hypothetical protein